MQLSHLLLLFVHCVHSYQSPIYSLEDLNRHIEEAKSPEEKIVGFLSEGNWHNHMHELSDNTIRELFEDTNHMYDALRKGSIIAGLISGVPHANFTHFDSKIVSLKTMYVHPKRNKLLEALDYAVVNIQLKGLDYVFSKNNQPYELISTPTCKLDIDLFTWPNKTEIGIVNDTIKIASLGPYNWGSDGNYNAVPPTGYWVDYYNEIEKMFNDQYGIHFEREWFQDSDTGLECIESERCDTSEPYYTVAAGYNNKTRKNVFDMSCSTGGTVPTYLTYNVVEGPARDDSLSKTIIPIVIALSFSSCALFAFIMYIIRREKKGYPLFETSTITPV